MNIDAYLTHIGITERQTPDLAFLTRLQRQHMLTVPFENLSVMHAEPVVLDERLLFAKIVARRRGGFCYELNGLFSWLLRELGYTVTRLSAGVYKELTGDFGPDFDHMTLLVHLGDDHQSADYLVDVGFGDSFRTPMAMPDGMVMDVGGTFRITWQQTPAVYYLEKQVPSGWQPQFIFTPAARVLTDYVSMCQHHQSSPDSSFTQRRLCTIATKRGRITLAEDTLTVTANGKQTKQPVASDDEWTQHLQTHFGIVLN